MFNNENVIKETITSVVSQTYFNWELLLIDDCSSDNTVEVVTEYSKSDPSPNIIKGLGSDIETEELKTEPLDDSISNTLEFNNTENFDLTSGLTFTVTLTLT